MFTHIHPKCGRFYNSKLVMMWIWFTLTLCGCYCNVSRHRKWNDTHNRNVYSLHWNRKNARLDFIDNFRFSVSSIENLKCVFLGNITTCLLVPMSDHRDLMYCINESLHYLFIRLFWYNFIHFSKTSFMLFAPISVKMQVFLFYYKLIYRGGRICYKRDLQLVPTLNISWKLYHIAHRWKYM